jgi:amino-acid N-acetyltransferase
MFKIRAAQSTDLGAVERLLTACSLPIVGVGEHIEEGYAVATREEGIVGVAGIEVCGQYGLLRSVAVAITRRGTSVGKALVDDRLAWAEVKGLTRVFLLTDDAARYFEQFGFSPVDRKTVPDEVKVTEEFASICPESAVVMMKSINPLFNPAGCCLG